MAAPSTPDGLDALRDLLVAPERDAIEALRAQLDDPAFGSHHLARALPDALAQSRDDHRLREALVPPVEAVITTSVRRNPRPLAEALFPVIGPAIRKAIAHALSGMVESLNRTLEQSVSARAFKWRLDAWRTGRPFAEVVLLNTLVYRVEQVFLIHAETGLLLQHVVADAVPAQHPDMVSGMLTAIRDFARDSFGGATDDTLDTFRVGELTGLVEQGPRAYLAAVVRGTPPPDLRITLQRAIETIHLRQADDLERFDGDASIFDDTRPVLQECLEARYRTSEAPVSYRRWWIALGVAIAGLAVWLGLRWVDGRRFDRYLAALAQQPGLVVVDGRRSGRQFVVTGLRDPLAVDPQSLVAASGLGPQRVTGRWQLYQGTDPRLALPRATVVLQPPPGIALSMRGDTLVAAGEASSAWIRDAVLLARTVPGVGGLDVSRVENAELRAAGRRIESRMLQFERGTAALAPHQDGVLAELVDEIRQLDARAQAVGVRLRLVITGHTDADGPPERNLALSRDRAAAVVAAVSREPLAALELEARGVGSAQPVAHGDSEADKQRNRRVAAHIEPLGSAAR